MARALAVVVLLGSTLSQAHDVSADLGVNLAQRTDANPRTGSTFASVGGGYDVNDSWTAWGALNFSRDLPTRTAETTSTGANTFLASAGAMWLASDHLLLLGGLSLSPKSSSLNATALAIPPRALELLQARNPDFPAVINAVVRSDNSSLGATLSGLWATNGVSDFESTVDVSAAVTSYSVVQQIQFPTVEKAQAFKSSCEDLVFRRLAVPLCALAAGVTSRLAQVRAGAGYTATVRQKLDLGLDAALFFYTANPNDIGYFSLTQLGGELGNGVPVAPYVFTARLAGTYRFSRVTLRLAYQLGAYYGGTGINNLLTLKTTVKVSKGFRVSLTLSGQADRDAVGSLGGSGSAAVGATYVF